ncbi:MAG: 30S ribosomal protein S6 [Chloroflexi bacterium]|nr:30S ribosomal protein S6 [Chloroflexota bacterium]
MVAERVRDYELVMVLSPEFSDEELTAGIERVSRFITDRGGSVSEQEVWGLRRLAYPVKRFLEGTYVLTRFKLDAANVGGLDRNLRASEDVLRHLVTRS